MQKLTGDFRENMIFVCVSLAVFLSEPALAGQQSEYTPENFTEPLRVSRGKVVPPSPEAFYLSHDDTCRYLVGEQGWDTSDCSHVENLVGLPVGGIDTMIIGKPADDGFVKFDDWSESQEEIDALWKTFAEATAEQGKRLKKAIRADRWYVYPTLRKDQAFLYYAILLDWEGEKVINVKASKFDRYGFLPFTIVPIESEMPAADLEKLVQATLNSYSSEEAKSYFDFREGDKVAAVGAVGVLATLMGVKYGKAAAAGILAILLALGKKFIFLLLLVPVAIAGVAKWLFGRRDTPQA